MIDAVVEDYDFFFIFSPLFTLTKSFFFFTRLTCAKSISTLAPPLPRLKLSQVLQQLLQLHAKDCLLPLIWYFVTVLFGNFHNFFWIIYIRDVILTASRARRARATDHFLLYEETISDIQSPLDICCELTVNWYSFIHTLAWFHKAILMFTHC